MTQANLGTIIPTAKTGTALASDLTNFEDALLTNHSGGSRPTYAQTGTIWGNSASAHIVFNVYDGADDIPVFQMDATNNVARVAMDADGDTYIVAAVDDQISGFVAGSEKFRFDALGLTLNPGAANELVIDDINDIIPAGAVMAFAMSTEPTGWMECDGAAISRTTYAALFAAIGTTYGVGDGSTTFNLPDLRAEFIRGWDNARGVDTGRALGSAQLDAFQGHHHDLDYPNTGASGGALTVTLQTAASSNILSNTATDAISDGTNGTPRTAAETRPRNIAMMYCIKY